MTSEELRAALEALGMSQRQLAREAGMDPTSINRWATGSAKVPKLAEAYVRLKLDVKLALDRASGK